jgi:hypothetical protein
MSSSPLSKETMTMVWYPAAPQRWWAIHMDQIPKVGTGSDREITQPGAGLLKFTNRESRRYTKPLEQHGAAPGISIGLKHGKGAT